MHTREGYSSFNRIYCHIKSNCFAVMLSLTFHSHSFFIFTYIHDFTEVPRFLMKHAVHWNLHSISNLNFRQQHPLHTPAKQGAKTATTVTYDT